MADILDTSLNEEDYHPDEFDEREILGDDDNNGDIKKEDDDLYDDVIKPSSVNNKRESSASDHHPYKANGSAVTQLQKQDTSKRYCCYVGNMTWWSTDADLQSLIQSCGVDDLVDIKFYENRNNGQSKGYALAVFMSENSVKSVMEKLPSKELYGQHLVVLPYTKQSLARFEEATKRAEQQKDKKDDKTSGMVNIGTFRIGTGQTSSTVPMLPRTNLPPPNMVSTGIPGGLQGLLGAVQSGPPGVPVVNLAQRPMVPTIQPIMQRPPVNLSAPPPSIPPANVVMSRPPPGFPNMSVAPPTISGPPLNQMQMRPPQLPTGGAPNFPPGAHINPNVYPNFAQGFGDQLSEVEFEEIMNRNRTVSSSAISRAVSDAAAGDYPSAIETLVTAISLIRQSRVANDDRCKVLITSLQDTLHGIESKSYSSRKHRSGRDRSRSPSDRKRRRRSRSRSRSRDRYDYSPSPSRRRY